MQKLWTRTRRAIRTGLERLGLIGPVYRAIERRIAARVDLEPGSADGLPMPIPYLMMLVAGNPDPEAFVRHGRELADRLTELLARHGRTFDAPQTVLDFGCGCGRVARHIAPRVLGGGGRYLGLDINARLSDWCEANLPGEYALSSLRPPAPLEAGAVDLLFAVSVFTHLSRESMEDWLADFARLLSPGGVAFVSFADEGRITTDRLPDLEASGSVLSTRALEGSNYMSSYVLSRTFAEMAARHLQVVEVAPSLASGETLAWAVLTRC